MNQVYDVTIQYFDLPTRRLVTKTITDFRDKESVLKFLSSISIEFNFCHIYARQISNAMVADFTRFKRPSKKRAAQK